MFEYSDIHLLPYCLFTKITIRTFVLLLIIKPYFSLYKDSSYLQRLNVHF